MKQNQQEGGEQMECVGVVLSWAGRPEPYFHWSKERGFKGTYGYLPRSLTAHIKRNENDWPLNEDGTKMKIWERQR